MISGLAFATALAATACGGSSGPGGAIVPPLSKSLYAEEDFRKIRDDWARSSDKERIAMRARLEAFAARYPDDGEARMAGALLAWVELEQGHYRAATVKARAVEKLGRGTPADVARAVEGAAWRRSGEPEPAIVVLTPLVEKLVDPWARELVNEEIVAAAIAAKWPERALELMGTWLREANEDDREGVAAQVDALTATLPEDVLANWLDQPAEIETTSGPTLRGIVALRVASIAKRKKDMVLAQRVLATASGLLGQETEAIAALAAGANRARVEARTVGLLLSIRGGGESTRRSAEVAAGVAAGLGLPDSPARLVSRDDGGQVDRVSDALGNLSVEGASIVIGGFDVDSATAMARYAEANELPVLLLRPPKGSIEGAKYTFVVGEDPARVEGELVKALAARGDKPIALLSDAATPPAGADLTMSCSDAAPATKTPKLASVVLGPSASCGRVLGGLTLAPKTKLAVAWDAFGIVTAPGTTVASSGLFPIDADAPPAATKAWVKAHRDPPSIWSGLGHDAAVLAYASVQGLADQGTEDPKEVLERRRMTAAAIEKASGELWTTDAKGFDGKHTLARAITIKETK